MGKKRKIQNIGTAGTISKPVTSAVKSAVKLKESQSLISFDKKVKIFLLLLITLYFLLSFLKIHTSSIANWDIFFGKPESESVISGKPRFIRMDEWMVFTPAALSQYKMGLPVQNQGLGAKNAPVVMGSPVKHFTSIFRPAIWSYFLFDEERAFAFSWNFNIFFFLISAFLVFMLLTGNNFWLSIFGAFFIFFSAGVQWWSYQVAYQMMYLNGMFLSFIYLLYSNKFSKMLLAGVCMIFSISGFLFVLYPAFQIPLIYLYLALSVGYILQRKDFKLIKDNISKRGMVLGGVVLILGLFLYQYYNLVKDTYEVVMNTVYPGKRFSTGGDLVKGKFFSEFFGMFMSDSRVPEQWLNICEVSSFIMLFPVIFYAIGYNFLKRRKINPLLLCLSIYILILSAYILVGFPAFLSKLSLLSLSPSYRALPILGAGNAVLLICYLGNRESDNSNTAFSWLEAVLLSIGVIAFVWLTTTYINEAVGAFFTSKEVSTATFLISAAYILTRYKQYKFVKPVLYLVLIVILFPNLSVNPITKGLSAANTNPLALLAKQIHDKDPLARWCVYGKQGWEGARIAQALTSQGINTFNGVKFVPPLEEMRQLDTERRYDSAYNRYAWVTMNTYIAGKDSVIFYQTANDGYAIYMDPCSLRLKNLGVNYFIFIYKPEAIEVQCMVKIVESNGLFIYKRKD